MDFLMIAAILAMVIVLLLALLIANKLSKKCRNELSLDFESDLGKKAINLLINMKQNDSVSDASVRIPNIMKHCDERDKIISDYESAERAFLIKKHSKINS